MLFNVGDINIETSVDSGDSDQVIVNQFASAAGTVQSISFYISPGTNVGTGYGVAYDSTGAGGAPGNLIAATNSVSLVNAWNTNPVVTPVFISAQNIYIGFLLSSGSAGPMFTEPTTGAVQYFIAGQVTPPNPFGTGTAQPTILYSVYATLSASYIPTTLTRTLNIGWYYTS